MFAKNIFSKEMLVMKKMSVYVRPDTEDIDDAPA